MAGYPKIWTTIKKEPWFIEMNASWRGIFLQMIIDAKAQGDTGEISYRGWADFGSQMGADPRTVRACLEHCQSMGRAKILQNCSKIVRIMLTKYSKHQQVKAPFRELSNSTFNPENPKEPIEPNRTHRRAVPETGIEAEKQNRTNLILEYKTKLIYDWYCIIFERQPGHFKLTEVRKKKIQSRLAEFTTYDLWAAMNALSDSDWHMGDNPNKNKYIEIESNLFKSYEQTDKWRNKFIDSDGGRDDIDRRDRELDGFIERSSSDELQKLIAEKAHNPGAPERVGTNAPGIASAP